jgi:hypothetical protein
MFKRNVFFIFLVFAFSGTAILAKETLQSSQCPKNKFYVRSHTRKSYLRSDGTNVRQAFVKSYCKDLTASVLFIKSRVKSGIPSGWPHKKETSRPWTEEEIQRLMIAVEDFPESLLSETVAGIYRLKKSIFFPNPATSADGIIVVYDTAFEHSRNLGQIILHEVAHQNYKDLSEKLRQDYRRATGWTVALEPDGTYYWVGRKEGYVEEDGKNSHEEDYANNLQHFYFDSDTLKKVTPTAYEWFLKKFGQDFKQKREK